MEMVEHIAYNYLVEPSITFRSYSFLSKNPISQLHEISFDHLPSFVILFRGEMIPFSYQYDEYQRDFVLSETDVYDFINDYLNTDVIISGGRHPLPGRIPSVDTVIKRAARYNQEQFNLIEEAIQKATSEFDEFKPIYREALQVIQQKGVEGVWEQVNDLRKSIKTIQLEEDGMDEDSEDSEDLEDSEDSEDLEDLELLNIRKNIFRAFARDIPVYSLDEEEL